MSTNRTVQIIATESRYRKEPYKVLATYVHGIGTYLTGQHIDPKNQETKGNLTKEQIEGTKQLSTEQAKMFPFVIKANIYYPFEHLRKFNLNQNEDGTFEDPMEKALLDLFKLQLFVAPSKDTIISETHYFYIKDEENEAIIQLTKREKRFKAEKLVRENSNLQSYRNIALLLNYRIDKFNINLGNITETILQNKLFDACENYPDDILMCFTQPAKEDLFFLKLEYYGIIKRKEKSFYDGSQFLGDTIEGVKKFAREKEGSSYMNRWSRLLAEKENIGDSSQFGNKTDYQKYITECSLSLLKRNLQGALMAYDNVFNIDPNGKELPLLQESINALRLDINTKTDTYVRIQKELNNRENLNDNNPGQIDSTIETEKIYREELNKKEFVELQEMCSKSKRKKEDWKNLDKSGIITYLVSFKKFE